MRSFEVKFYTGEYSQRQAGANHDEAICYVEHHFNAANDTTTNYTCVIVADNAGDRSKQWGTEYSIITSNYLEIRNIGVKVGGFGGRGNGNLKHTVMPAILVEPLMCSSKAGSEVIKTPFGIEGLACCLVLSIQKCFPEGGLVAFSIGHKGKPSSPNDRGAKVYGGGTEADYAEQVMMSAARMLRGLRPKEK